MTEEKEVVDTTDPQASEEQEEFVDESKEESEEPSQIDYKSELEVEKKRRERAEFALYKSKQDKKEEPEEKTDFDPSEIKNLIKEAIGGELGVVRHELDKARVEQMAHDRATNSGEADLILWHYTNSIKPTGNLKEDMDNAYVLANRKKFVQENSEAKRALLSKDKKGAGSGAGQKPKPKSEVPQLSDSDKKFIESSGMKWNPESEQFEGKYASYKLNKQTNKWESGLKK